MKQKQTISRLKSLNLKNADPEPDSRQPLWRQIPSAHKINQNNLNQYKKNSEQAESQNSLITPIRKKKQKSETISNFLKHLQVDVDHKDSRMDTESEIISMMDVKYTDSFYTHKRHLLGKSIIADSKFHISLLIASIKQCHQALTETVQESLNSYRQQMNFMSVNVKKLLVKYQSDINEKTTQIKNLQLEGRQQRLNNVEEKYRIETQLRLMEQKNRQLQLKLQETERKYKQQQQICKNQKSYNKELNEMILKFHKRVEQLELKSEQLKKQYQESLFTQIERLTEKYEQMYHEQSQNYELKLENNRIKYENYIQMNMSPGFGGTNSDFSKISDIIHVDLTKSIISKVEDPKELNWISEFGRKTQGFNQASKKWNKNLKEQTESHLQDTSSPKSNTSGRRFARTSKPTQIEIIQKQRNQVSPTVHLAQNSKQFLSENKTQRFVEQSDYKNGQTLNRQKFSNHNAQNSQPELLISRSSKTRVQSEQGPLITPDKSNVVQLQICKLLEDSPAEIPINSKSPPQTRTHQRLAQTIKVGTKNQQQNSNAKIKLNLNSRDSNNMIANNLGSTTTSTMKSNTGTANGNNHATSNKNVVYIERKLRETFA